MDRVTVIPNFAAARDLNDLKRMLTQHWSEMANLVNNSVTLYVQDTQPTIPNNMTSLWQDTSQTPNEYYLVSSFGGTHRVLHPKELVALHFLKARAYRNAAQSLTGAQDNKILIDTDSYDPSSITDLTNNRIKPTQAGYYQVCGQVYVSDLPTNAYINIKIKKTGSPADVIVAFGGHTNSANAEDRYCGLVVTDIIYLDGVNDYVELWSFPSADVALYVANNSNFLSVVGPF